MAPRSKSSSASRPDPVKQQVAAHWDRRAPTFDEDFGHSIRTPDERAAWDRILDLVVGGRAALDALDAGCGTGFLAFELTARGHRVTGVDFAPAMIAQARRKAAAAASRSGSRRPTRSSSHFRAGTFDLVISRHVLWTLPHPGGGDRRVDPGPAAGRTPGRRRRAFRRRRPGAAAAENARASHEYAAIGDQLPFLGGRSREEIEALLQRARPGDVRSDPLLDLVAAQDAADGREGREPPHAPTLRRLGRPRGLTPLAIGLTVRGTA